MALETARGLFRSADLPGKFTLTGSDHGPRLRWAVPQEGFVVECAFVHGESVLRMVPRLHNTSPDDLRVMNLFPCAAGALKFGGDIRALTDSWERCYGDCSVVRVDARTSIHSAWDLHLFDRQGARAFSVSYLDIPNAKIHIDLNGREGGADLDLSVRMDLHAGANGLRLAPGEEYDPGAMMLRCGEGPANAWLEAYADMIARHNNLPVPGPVPTGWVDWYFSFAKTTEEDILRNLDFIARELKDFGLMYVQIDSGWQLGVETSPAPHNTVAGGPWTENAKFARGMKWFADQIRARGLLPGLWVRPFQYIEGAPERTIHPDWFNRRGQMDLTHPEVQAVVRDVFRKIVHEWGYAYIKYDFVAFDYFGEFGPKASRDVVAIGEPRDQSRTGIQAYRETMQEIRTAVGSGAGILACNSIMPATLGAADAYRIGDDVGNWERTFRYGVGSVGPRYFTNGTFWSNDPDCLLVREPFTQEQAQMWGSLVALSGGVVFISENLAALPSERLSIIKKCLPVYANPGHGYRFGRPIDLLDRVPAAIWHLPVRRGFAAWDVIGFFNWTDRPDAFSVARDSVGIPDDVPLLACDFWADRYLGEVRGALTLEVPAMSCRVVSLRAASGRPQVISTNRHLTQGGVELLDLRWDDRDLALTGSVQAVARNPYELVVHVPAAFALDQLDGLETPDDASGLVQRWRVPGLATAPLAWRARFTRT
jgi:hypothetical protein